MDLPRVVGWAKGHRNVLVVAALILVFAGADLLLNPPKGRAFEWFSIPLLAAGFVVLGLLVWPTAKQGPRAPGNTLARRVLDRLTWRGRLTPFLPIGGIAVVLADLSYNVFLSDSPALLTHDTVVLLFGGALIAYPFVPSRFERERDFVFLFLLALSLFLVVPLILLRIVVGDSGASVDAYSAAALAPQTSAILNLIGVPNTLVVDSDGTPGLSFVTAAHVPVTVLISSACSGVYSFAVFASAFAAFVLTEQRKLTPRVLLFFGLGVFLAYVANILRMVVIVWIGYRFDTPGTDLGNLLLAHSNAGWIIFLAWIALFWFLLFRFLPRESSAAATQVSPGPARRRGAYCGICGIVLTPAIPATLCDCGKMYHQECLIQEGRCPQCAAPFAAVPFADPPTA